LNYNEEHNELFDLYLQGKLQGADLAAFESRLSADKAFAEAFQVHRILVEGIRDHGRQELKNYLKEHGKVHLAGKSARPFNMRYAAAAAIVLVAGIYAAVHFYISPSTAPEIAVSTHKEKALSTDSNGAYSVPEHLQEHLAENSPPPPALKEEAINQPSAFQAPEVVETEIIDRDEIGLPPVADVVESDLVKREDNLTVLSEKRLQDSTMTVPVLFVFLDEQQSDKEESKTRPLSEISVKKATTESYEPQRNRAKGKSAKLPRNYDNNASNSNNSGNDTYKAVADSVQVTGNAPAANGAYVKANKDLSNRKIQVEFWQSPVHFRGYKYTANNIILYSVQPASARIFIVNGKTYLRTEGIVYLLESCADGCEFKPETNKQIIDFILQQP
jgi:hypothetical protein